MFVALNGMLDFAYLVKEFFMIEAGCKGGDIIFGKTCLTRSCLV